MCKCMPAPSISAPGPCSDTRSALERAPQIMKLLWSFFRSGQKSGHQRSPKAKFCFFSAFLYKMAHNSGTRRATAPRKNAFDRSLTVFG